FLQLSSPFTPLRSPASPKPPKSLSPSNNPSPPLSKSNASLAEKDPELNSSIISSSSTSSSEPATNLLSKNFSNFLLSFLSLVYKSFFLKSINTISHPYYN